MAAETPIPIDVPPGMVMTQSPLSSRGRWTGGNWVRFWRGRPQKIGGYVNMIEPGSLIGIPRGCHQWNDLTARQLIAVGSSLKLNYIPDTDWVPIDITPIIASTTLNNKISTTNGESIINVNWASHGGSIGQYVDISGSTDVGGISPNGNFPIVEVVDANNFTVDTGLVATSTAGPGGGAAILVRLELAPGGTATTEGFGWGSGTWGTGTWGTPREYTTVSFWPRFWALSNFGRTLIAIPLNGAVYKLDPADPVGTRATYVATAPTYALGGFVTSEQIVLAYGSNYDSTLPGVGSALDQDYMQWWASAQGDFTDWDTTSTGTPSGTPSVSGRLAQGSRIIGGGDLGIHVSLLWTDTALYQFQYTGSEFVFNVLLAGKECGLIGPLAFVIVGTEAYWMGANGLFMYNGGVQRIPNYQDVSEYVLATVSGAENIKSVCFYNQQYNEVWFLFTPVGSQEPIKYVVVNRDDWSWTAGALPEAMSCATRQSGVDPRPTVFGIDGDLYQMDNTKDADGVAIDWSLSTDGLEVGKGESWTEIYGLAVDMERQTGDMTVRVDAYDRTPASPSIIDTDSATIGETSELEDLRLSGRIFAVTFSGGSLGGDFRMGVPKLLAARGGARR